jgi:thioredoxin-related protein
MKRILLVAALVSCVVPVFAGDKTADDTKIHWMNLDEVQTAMKTEPRKVLIDVYTGWCGWCKRMDATTYESPDVIKYINKNFYAVKLDAERKDSLRFVGKMYGYSPDQKANTVAIDLLHGQMSYPSTVFMEKGFQMITNVAGYHNVPEWEMILKYLAEDKYKTVKWEDYQKEFKATWAEVAPKAGPGVMSPPGH